MKRSPGTGAVNWITWGTTRHRPIGVIYFQLMAAKETTLKELGEAERAKFGGVVTVSETVVLCNKPPDVPVMVIVAVPRAAVLLAVRVSVLVAVVVPGLNAAVTPFGRPEAERFTLLLKPFSGLMLMVLVPFAP